MAKRLCMENLNTDCRNPQKGLSIPGISDGPELECPYCLRIDGKDGTGMFICEPEKAIKIFEMFKDKLEGNE